jgi:histone H3/H4
VPVKLGVRQYSHCSDRMPARAVVRLYVLLCPTACEQVLGQLPHGPKIAHSHVSTRCVDVGLFYIVARMTAGTHTTHAMSIARFERFFREAAALDVDKDDIKRLGEFLNHNIEDLLTRATAIAKANLRPAIAAIDLPITAGLQERMFEFRRMDADIGLLPILNELTIRPPLDLPLSDETDAELPAVAGGLSLALAQTFKIIDSRLKNPSSEHWERSFRLFDLLL